MRNWIDKAAGGRSVALLPYSVSRDWFPSAVAWWDAEFWNSSIVPTYVGPNGRFTYAPFPSKTLRIDPRRRRRRNRARTEVRPCGAQDSRFGLAGKQVAANVGLTLLKVKRPVARDLGEPGLYPDGWITPGPSGLRSGSSRSRATARRTSSVAVTLDSPPEATGAGPLSHRQRRRARLRQRSAQWPRRRSAFPRAGTPTSRCDRSGLRRIDGPRSARRRAVSAP